MENHTPNHTNYMQSTTGLQHDASNASPLEDNRSESSTSPGTEELYAGRKIQRSERLKQMRESQKLLREQRRNKVKILEDDNAKLRQELENVKKLGNSGFAYIDKLQLYSGTLFFPIKYVENPQVQGFANTNISTYFISIPPEKTHKLYLNDAKNVLYLAYAKILKYIKQFRLLGKEGEIKLDHTTFRYAPNLAAKYDYSEYLEIFVRTIRLPPSWLISDTELPRGVILLIDIVDYMVKYSDILLIDMEVLSSYLSCLSFATYWGPCICVIDLSRSINAASDPTFDVQLVGGVLEEHVNQFVAAARKRLAM